MTATVTSTALELADEFRGACSRFDLWRLADWEARGEREGRLVRYRHALIHAGYIRTVKGRWYKRCPMCHHKLHWPGG